MTTEALHWFAGIGLVVFLVLLLMGWSENAQARQHCTVTGGQVVEVHGPALGLWICDRP